MVLTAIGSEVLAQVVIYGPTLARQPPAEPTRISANEPPSIKGAVISGPPEAGRLE